MQVWSCHTSNGINSYLTLRHENKFLSEELVALRYNVLTKTLFASSRIGGSDSEWTTENGTGKLVSSFFLFLFFLIV